MEGSLVLEDGTVARGPFFGARRRILGELVFNTNMTGYTEALTDPSYRGQILMMTYPLIGNYGVYPDTRNLVAEASCTTLERYPGPEKRTIVVVDCGVKRNILREAQRYAKVVRVPYDTTSDEILSLKPDGVILSNGPGDPAHPDIVATSVRTTRELAGRVPLLGICLGHQLLALAFGGKTFKLKFGHRGGNQPVKDLRTGRVHITSQNHGFAVDSTSPPEAEFEVTHVNLNDGTVEGMAHRELPILPVQYLPARTPGSGEHGSSFP